MEKTYFPPPFSRASGFRNLNPKKGYDDLTYVGKISEYK